MQPATQMILRQYRAPISAASRAAGRLLTGALLLAFLFGCGGAAVATPQPTTLRIAGSTAMLPVLSELARAFSRQHPNVLFDIRGGGSAVGEQRLREGQIDLAASTLLARPGGETAEDALRRAPFGIDGVAIVVHGSNPVASLSLDELRDLFSGRITDWSELGSDAGEVMLVSREDGSGTRRAFEERVMGNERVALTAVVMPTSADVVDYVAAHPQAIGYVSRGLLADLLGDGPRQTPTPSPTAPARTVRIVAVDERLPTVEAIGAGTYPIAQPLLLVSRGEPDGWSRQFVDFTLSPAGQQIVGAYHARVR